MANLDDGKPSEPYLACFSEVQTSKAAGFLVLVIPAILSEFAIIAPHSRDDPDD